MAKRPKRKTIAQELDKAAVLLQKLVRMKAADDHGYAQCVSCGKIEHWKKMDGGHWLSRRHSRTRCLEENIHPQCKRCNMLMGDPQVHEAYRDYMVKMYGERRVRAMKKLTYLPPKKFDRAEVIAFQEEVKKRIKIESIRLGEI